MKNKLLRFKPVILILLLLLTGCSAKHLSKQDLSDYREEIDEAHWSLNVNKLENLEIKYSSAVTDQENKDLLHDLLEYNKMAISVTKKPEISASLVLIQKQGEIAEKYFNGALPKITMEKNS